MLITSLFKTQAPKTLLFKAVFTGKL